MRKFNFMLGLGLQVSINYAKENWDKRGICAYSLDSGKDWVITDIEELDNLDEDVIIYIEND